MNEGMCVDVALACCIMTADMHPLGFARPSCSRHWRELEKISKRHIS